MSKLRSLNTVIWSDVWFETLDPEGKLLFIYFVTNEKTNMLGVYEISVRKVSFETGIEVIKIEGYLKKFEQSGKIRYASHRILLLNFLKHQNYNFNMMKSAIRTYNNLPKELKTSPSEILEETKQGFETLCKGFAGVRKIEYEYEYEVESEVKSEYTDAYSFLEFKNKGTMEVFEMQNRKSFPDWENFKLNFNSKVVEEKLDWDFDILYSRLLRLNGNWDKKSKNPKSNQINKPVSSNR